MPTHPSDMFAPTQAPAAAPRASKPARHRRDPWRWLRQLMQSRIRLERRGIQIHVLLEPAAGVAQAEARVGRGSDLRRDHEALHDLLAQRPEFRLTMRSLAYVEQALARKGSRAFKGDPPKLYAKALRHLERVMREEPGMQFPELERRLRIAAAQAVSQATESDFKVAVQVTEASHSLFDEMERSWTGQLPPSAFDSTLAEEAGAGTAPAH